VSQPADRIEVAPLDEVMVIAHQVAADNAALMHRLA
jgi:hypothetical protein